MTREAQSPHARPYPGVIPDVVIFRFTRMIVESLDHDVGASAVRVTKCRYCGSLWGGRRGVGTAGTDRNSNVDLTTRQGKSRLGAAEPRAREDAALIAAAKAG